MAVKRKTTTAIVAGVAAVALLLGGTFAWTSISQQAKNETAGIVNVGGRLHDDFNGTNKDVYVENFTDPYNGGQPIYARIKLTEYMEVGKDAGGIDVDNDGTIDAVPVIAGTDRNDVTTWKTHIPSTDSVAECDSGDTCLIHEHWRWDLGNTESITYMPTFNKDKDSLAADINGTYAGTNPDDKVYYDDYVVYTTEEGGIVVDMADPNFTPPEGAVNATPLTEAQGSVSSVTGTAYYDNDFNMSENTVEGEYTTKTETHTAKQTPQLGGTMLMSEWDGVTPGDNWIIDEDGWAYWANPIMPGEATGLLLNGIEMFKNPGEKCYYAINVVAQFATVGDWEQFGVSEDDPDYPSERAIELLTVASESVPTVTVTNTDGKTLVNRGDEVTFSATTAIGAASAAAESEYEWVVLNEDREVITSSTVIDNGDGTATLTVGSEELSEGLYVAARDTKTGAVGLSAVAMQLYDVTISEQNGTTVAKAGATLNFSALVVDSITGAEETTGVTWSLRGNSADTTTNISNEGVLTIDENEPGATVLTVTATSNNGSFVQTYTVTVADKYTVTVSQADDAAVVFPGDELQFSAAMTKNGETVTPDIEWTVTGGSGTTAIDQNGLLTVDEDEKGAATLTVKATCKADETVSGTYTVRVDRYEITLSGGASTITPGTYSQFNAAVTLNGKSITSDITWKVTDAAGAQVNGVTVDDTGKVSVAETVAEGTELIVTATANGVADPVSVSRQLTVKKAELVMRLYDNNDFNDLEDTVYDGDNKGTILANSLATQIRVYDKDGNWIKGDQATMTVWLNGQDITGVLDGTCTNGYDATNGHWWAWVGASNDGTKVTFKITYGVSTFEATIW